MVETQHSARSNRKSAHGRSRPSLPISLDTDTWGDQVYRMEYGAAIAIYSESVLLR